MSDEDFFCEVSGCQRSKSAKGLCSSHYGKVWRGASFESLSPLPPLPECRVDGCARSADSAQGVCKRHYAAARSGAIVVDGISALPACAVEGCRVRAMSGKTPYCESHMSDPSREVGRWSKRGDECSEPECSSPVLSRGLCSRHYGASRRVPSDRAKVLCGYGPCEKAVRGGREYCAKHGRQMAEFGYAWDGARPRGGDPVCVILGCTSRVSSLRGDPLCTVHRRAAKVWGISRDRFAQLKNSPCDVCGANDEASCLDHDHSCCPGPVSTCGGGCIRGPLCQRCNSALGHAKDSPERLRALAEYLERG